MSRTRRNCFSHLDEKQVGSLDALSVHDVTCVQDADYVNCVYDLVSDHADNFNEYDLYRMFRWASVQHLLPPNVVETLSNAAVRNSASISATKMCWIIWGLAKADRVPDRSSFDKMTEKIAAEIEVMHSLDAL